MRRPTPVFLDTSCLKHLRSPSARAQLTSQLRVIGSIVLPSVVNLLEVARHPVKSHRDELLAVLQALSAGHPIAPWPYSLLERVGRALLDGEPRFHFGAFSINFPSITKTADAARMVAEAEAEELESAYRAMFDDSRRRIRGFLHSHRLKDEWSCARDFLDRMWMRPEHIDSYIQGVWTRLGFTHSAPLQALRANPTWRIFFEAYGVAAFEQCFQPNQPRPFGLLDLLQLTYPTGFPMAHFVTADAPLKRAADILLEPLPGVRTSTFDDFFGA